jgi:DNA-binding transcriptional LysR family regulator
MLNLSDLYVFVTAAESKSFSDAGRRLRLSQPAVSQTIEKLEKEFADRLFLRQGRRVRLSEAGQALLPMARELLASANRVEESMACLHGEIVGEMVVGTSTASGRYLLPGLIADYHKEHPQVRIHVRVSSQEKVIERLQTGELALGMTGQRLVHRDLECQAVFIDEVILIVPTDHPWAGRLQVSLEDLLDEPIIMREEGAGTRRTLMETLHVLGITPEMLKNSMELGDPEAIVLAVEAGLGVAFVSRLAAARSLETGRVAEVEVSGMELHRNIYLTRSCRIPPTRAQANFWDFVIHERSGRRVTTPPSSRAFERQPS